MLKTPLMRLRTIGWLEGASYLFLLGIAMPLKYLMDMPWAVRYTGMLHGLLFVLYMLAVAHVTYAHRWSIKRIFAAVTAAFVPFGNFLLDIELKKEQSEYQKG